MRRCLPPLLLALVLAASAPAGAAPTREYVVQDGDTCWNIAERLFGEGTRYDQIHQLNDLGPMPHILRRGQKLVVPGAESVPDARVGWRRNDVSAKAPHAVDWTPAREEMALWQLYKVATGDESSASIRFTDSSSLRMRDNALLVIYASARRSKEAGQPRTTVKLEKGQLRGGLAALDAGQTLEVQTPAAKVELGEGDAQVGVDAKDAATVAVYRGKARVQAKGATVEVPAGKGTRVRRGKKPEPPRPLPAAPAWAEGAGDVVIPAPRGDQPSYQAAWRPVDGARFYRVELSDDDTFSSPAVDVQVDAAVTRFEVRELAPGAHHVRVSALDELGLEGPASTPTRIDVVELESSRALVRGPDGALEAVGLIRLSLDEASAARSEASIDGGAFGPAAEPIRLAGVGAHRLAWRPRGGGPATTLTVRLLDFEAHLTPPARPLREDGQPDEARIAVRDERGRPASLPGLALQAYPGGPLALEAREAGVFAASVRAPTEDTPPSVTLVASWAGGELARATVPVTVTRSDDAYRWAHGPSGVQWQRTAPALASRRAGPVSSLGVDAHIVGFAGGPLEHPKLVRSSVSGEWALLDGRLGLDAVLPWYDERVGTDDTRNSELGDLRLGARWLAATGGALDLAAGLRVAAPTGGWQASGRTTRVEPGLIVEYALADTLTLATTQVALGTLSDADSAWHWTSTWGAIARPFDWVSLAADVTSAVGLAGGASTGPALAAGGALRLHWGRLRLGLLAGVPLGDEGRRTLGRFTTGLTVDLATGDR